MPVFTISSSLAFAMASRVYHHTNKQTGGKFVPSKRKLEVMFAIILLHKYIDVTIKYSNDNSDFLNKWKQIMKYQEDDFSKFKYTNKMVYENTKASKPFEIVLFYAMEKICPWLEAAAVEDIFPNLFYGYGKTSLFYAIYRKIHSIVAKVPKFLTYLAIL